MYLKTKGGKKPFHFFPKVQLHFEKRMPSDIYLIWMTGLTSHHISMNSKRVVRDEQRPSKQELFQPDKRALLPEEVTVTPAAWAPHLRRVSSPDEVTWLWSGDSRRPGRPNVGRKELSCDWLRHPSIKAIAPTPISSSLFSFFYHLIINNRF